VSEAELQRLSEQARWSAHRRALEPEVASSRRRLRPGAECYAISDPRITGEMDSRIIEPFSFFQQGCSIARAMDVVGDPLVDPVATGSLLRHKAVDEFNIILASREHSQHAFEEVRRSRHDDAVPLTEHGGRYEYVLTKKGREKNFFPTYLALKKWGDDWLAEPEGPQVSSRIAPAAASRNIRPAVCTRRAVCSVEDIENRSRAVAPCPSIESGSAVRRPTI